MKIKVENMIGKGGRPVVNQFIIHTKDGWYFQSYKSIIAFIPNEGLIQLDRLTWNYSKTTSKYRNIFLDETTETTRKKIDMGVYLLTDLN